MTTLLQNSHNPKLPPPAAYRDHLDRRLPDHVTPTPSPAAGWVFLFALSILIGVCFALAL